MNKASETLNSTYSLNIRWDYLVHSILMLPSYFLVINTIKSRKKAIAPGKPTLIAIISTLILATSIELLHAVIPYRAFNINDILANLVGAFLAYILWRLIRHL